MGSKRRWKEIRDASGEEELVGDIVVQMASLSSQEGAKRICTDTDPTLRRPELDDDGKRWVVPIGRSTEVSESRQCPHSATTLCQSAAPIVLKNHAALERRGDGDGDGMMTEDVVTSLGGCETRRDC